MKYANGIFILVVSVRMFGFQCLLNDPEFPPFHPSAMSPSPLTCRVGTHSKTPNFMKTSVTTHVENGCTVGPRTQVHWKSCIKLPSGYANKVIRNINELPI